jgi:hypothetical protein
MAALRGETIGGIESTLACPGTKLEHTAFFSVRRLLAADEVEAEVDWATGDSVTQCRGRSGGRGRLVNRLKWLVYMSSILLKVDRTNLRK